MKKWIAGILCSAVMLGLCACEQTPQETTTTAVPVPTYPERKLSLCVGDTYDFAQMGYTIDTLDGTAVLAVGACITAIGVGEDSVIVSDVVTLEQYRYTVTVYADAKALGENYPVDRGLFAGKKIIVFGDSITDGCLLDPNTENGMNYEDTYFAQLCRYLDAASDPTDLESCNFACGGTMLTYGTNGYGISGVQRIGVTQPFTDAGRTRNPYPNIRTADLCIIFYGTNDLTAGVMTGESGESAPQKAEDAKTIHGAMRYMLCTLHEINPKMKILVLPPLYRRADGRTLSYSDDMSDVCNLTTGASLVQYRDAIAQACAQEGAKFVDWYPLFDYENFGKTGATAYSYDGLHPNVAGHRKMFEYLVEQLEKSNE